MGIVKGPFTGCKCESHHEHDEKGAEGCSACNPTHNLVIPRKKINLTTPAKPAGERE